MKILFKKNLVFDNQTTDGYLLYYIFSVISTAFFTEPRVFSTQKKISRYDSQARLGQQEEEIFTVKVSM